jgi:hypothetical protein
MSKLSDTDYEVTNLIVCVETHRNKSIGTLMRCAVAFGASIVVIVGSPKFSTHGAYEAKKFIKVIHFFYWKDCIDFVKSRGFTVYGISPRRLGLDSDCETPSDKSRSGTLSSVAADDLIFGRNFAAFIVGEKEGLTVEQISLCDTVLHIGFPHQDMEEYVHYDSKIAICFDHHASSSGFSQRSRQGEKYTLQEMSGHSDGLKACRLDPRPPHVDSEDGLLTLFGDDNT